MIKLIITSLLTTCVSLTISINDYIEASYYIEDNKPDIYKLISGTPDFKAADKSWLIFEITPGYPSLKSEYILLNAKGIRDLNFENIFYDVLSAPLFPTRKLIGLTTSSKHTMQENRNNNLTNPEVVTKESLLNKLKILYITKKQKTKLNPKSINLKNPLQMEKFTNTITAILEFFPHFLSDYINNLSSGGDKKVEYPPKYYALKDLTKIYLTQPEPSLKNIASYNTDNFKDYYSKTKVNNAENTYKSLKREILALLKTIKIPKKETKIPKKLFENRPVFENTKNKGITEKILELKIKLSKLKQSEIELFKNIDIKFLGISTNETISSLYKRSETFENDKIEAALYKAKDINEIKTFIKKINKGSKEPAVLKIILNEINDLVNENKSSLLRSINNTLQIDNVNNKIEIYDNSDINTLQNTPIIEPTIANRNRPALNEITNKFNQLRVCDGISKAIVSQEPIIPMKLKPKDELKSITINTGLGIDKRNKDESKHIYMSKESIRILIRSSFELISHLNLITSNNILFNQENTLDTLHDSINTKITGITQMILEMGELNNEFQTETEGIEVNNKAKLIFFSLSLKKLLEVDYKAIIKEYLNIDNSSLGSIKTGSIINEYLKEIRKINHSIKMREKRINNILKRKITTMESAIQDKDYNERDMKYLIEMNTLVLQLEYDVFEVIENISKGRLNTN